MRASICPGCGRTIPGDRQGRCPICQRAADRTRHTPTQRRVYKSALWRKMSALARRRDGNRCVRCGSRSKLSVHHLTSIRDGGDPFALDNLVTLCSRCHAAAERGDP